jgi:hypothetical protein
MAQENQENEEILLVIAKAGFKQTTVVQESDISQYSYFSDYNKVLKKTKIKTPENYDAESIKHYLVEVYNENMSDPTSYIENLDFKHRDNRTFLLEGLIKISIESSLNSLDIEKGIGQVLGEVFPNEEDRYDVLNLLSARIDAIYNDARNPFSNNSEYNPDNVTLPKGTIAARDLLAAAFYENKFAGGVCNDHAHFIAAVGKVLFPTKDILVVSQGTHMATAITDGKNIRIIDTDSQMQNTNSYNLREDPRHNANIRISIVVDDHDKGISKLKEIAVVKTQLGMAIDQVMLLDRSQLSTEFSPSTLVAAFKKNIQGKEYKKSILASVGIANLDRSDVLIISGKFEAKKNNTKYYGGLAYAHQFGSLVENDPGSIHIRLGSERNIVLYVHPQFDLHFNMGLHIDAGFGTSFYRYDTSGSLELDRSIILKYRSKKENDFKGNLKVGTSRSWGPKSWGETTGAISKFDILKLPQFFLGMKYHLNQVNVESTIEKKLPGNLSASISGSYLGSHIGQNIETQVRITNLSKNKKHQYYAYVGYANNELRGYSTKNNLLSGNMPTGANTGLGYANLKNGTQAALGLYGISPNSMGQLSLNLKVPLYQKTK